MITLKRNSCWFCFFFYFFLCSTTKCDIRQLPSFHVGRCNVTEFDDGSMNFEFSGIIGLDPLVRVFKMSEASPAPMLQLHEKGKYINECTKTQTKIKKKPKGLVQCKPIVSSGIDLIA